MDEFGQLKKTVTDLSPVMSSYLSKTGVRYHLHPELVNVGDTETCSLCVACLQVMNEEIEIEIEIEGIDPDSPDAEVKIAERRLLQQKIRAKSMSIAAGCDFGVLPRVQELTSPSILERSLLSPHRAYYVTVKVKSPTGLPGSRSLNGDIICFTQNGPAKALELLGSQGDTMRERIEWIRANGSFRVVLVDDKGGAEKWLHDHAVLLARPHVIFNELRVRAKIDEATGNKNGHPGPTDAEYEKEFVTPLACLAEDVFKQSRRIDTEDAIAVETLSQLKASDVASVRDIDNGGGLDSVGVMSSEVGIPHRDKSLNRDLETLLAVMEGAGVDGDGDDDDAGGDDELGSDNGNFDSDVDDKHVIGSPTLHPRPRIISSKLPRGSDAVYEFENNGLNIMTVFRHLFPMMFSKTICESNVFPLILFHS